jgi:nickel-type superoxide dismutase maturation protease
MGRLARRVATTSCLLALAACALAWSFDRAVVEGASMAPTFRSGDRLLLVRRLRPLRIGDLVALRDPRDGDRLLVKRVVLVRGVDVEVAGDNAAASTDSRTFGAVPASSVRHLVVRRYRFGTPS